jgi:hypothetical protein
MYPYHHGIVHHQVVDKQLPDLVDSCEYTAATYGSPPLGLGRKLTISHCMKCFTGTHTLAVSFKLC